jgi:tetratricopeptide (TPR) repeat protein
MNLNTYYYEFHWFMGREQILSKVISKFLDQPNTPLKVKYVHSFLKENNLVPKVEMRHPKNDFDSKVQRNAANSLYQKGEFANALAGYNMALCFAASDESMSYGYANRSAAYFELKMFDKCLENIRLARETGYPAKLLFKLEQREMKCHEAISKRSAAAGEVQKYQPNLSYPVSAENPNVADSIKLVVNEKYGRHFVAKQDLKVGDIVILDRPYQVYLCNEYNYKKCANCLAENQLNLIPCTGCNKTMFCSRSCLESAQKYHKILCPIINRNSDREIFQKFFILRTLLSLMHDFGSVKALAEVWAARSMKTHLPKFGGDEKTRQKNAFETFKHMEPDVDEPLWNLDDTFFMALVYCWLMDYTNLAVQLPDVESQDLFLDLFYRFSKIIERTTTTTHTLTSDNFGCEFNQYCES